MDNSAIIICDEIVDMEAKSNDGEIEKLPTNFNAKKYN